MDEIIKILMKRDGLSRNEAMEIVEDVKEQMEYCNYDPGESEEIFTSELGLELDYIPLFLFDCM